MAAGEEAPFSRTTLFWGISASLLAAAGFFLLATYAPDFRRGEGGGATPLSEGGSGYAGLVELMTLAGDAPVMLHRSEDLGKDALLIVTVPGGLDPEELDRIVEARSDLPTLYVLPKWQTVPLFDHRGWEARTGRIPAGELNAWMRRVSEDRISVGGRASARLDVEGRRIAAPRDLQTAADDDPVIAAGPGRGVLVYGKGEESYVLTDPDLLNNAALKDRATALAALALVDSLRDSGEPVMFDLLLHGGEATHDLGKLLVEPPFLPLTLTVLAAAALAFLHGLGRFGPPRREARAIPFGKRALADTTATLLGRAGRLGSLGGRYARLMRSRSGVLLGAPAGLEGEALDRWLDSRDKGEASGFSSLAQRMTAATSERALQAAAQDLHMWIARRTGERR